MVRAPAAAATVAALCAACYLFLSDGKCGDDAAHPMLPQGGAPLVDHLPSPSPSTNPSPNPNPNPNQGGAPLLDHLFSKHDLAVSLPKLAMFFVLKLTLLTPASLTQANPNPTPLTLTPPLPPTPLPLPPTPYPNPTN